MILGRHHSGRSSSKKMLKLRDVVDLDRYPIEDLASDRGRSLAHSCRQEFSESVLLELPGFLEPDARREILDVIERARPRAFCYQMLRSAYDLDDAPPGAPDDRLDASDPRMRPHRRHQMFLGYDEFEANSPLPRLFQSSALTEFLRAVLGEHIHPLVDPVMGICVAISADGDEIGWHFDSHRFAVTLLLQEAEAGGIFEYLPNARRGQENFDSVPAVFDGDDEAVRKVRFQAGSLMLFRGIDTLHRLTPVEGEPPRVLGLLSYDETPDRAFSDEFRMAVLGRTGLLSG